MGVDFKIRWPRRSRGCDGYLAHCVSLDLDFGKWRAVWQILDLPVNLAVNTDVDADVGRFDIPDVVISAQDEQLFVTVDLSCLQRNSGIAELHNS